MLADIARRHDERASEPVELDLRGLGRFEGSAGPLFAAALAGSLGHVSLRVILPEELRGKDWLAASGLAFALANRSGATVVPDGEASLEPWRRTWLPSSEQTWHKLFGEAPPNELFSPQELGETSFQPDQFGPDFAAFTNPHRQGVSPSRTHPINRVIWPWLDRLLPGPRRRLLPVRQRPLFVEDVGLVIDELVSNIAEHAVTLGFGPSVLSLVQVRLTRGGGERSFDRLHLNVWDNGPGIVRTARPKLDADSQELGDDALVAKLFSEEIPSWYSGRGLGLPAVCRVCRSYSGARLTVATGATRLTLDRGELRHSGGAEGFPLQGTVVSLMLPVGG